MGGRERSVRSLNELGGLICLRIAEWQRHQLFTADELGLIYQLLVPLALCEK